MSRLSSPYTYTPAPVRREPFGPEFWEMAIQTIALAVLTELAMRMLFGNGHGRR